MTINSRTRTSKRMLIWYVTITCLVVSGYCGATLAAQPERGLRIDAGPDVQDKTATIKDEQGKEVILYKESHALVIGMSNYTHGWPKLPGVQKDVEEVKAVLEGLGFNVIVKQDLRKDELEQAFNEFINRYGYEPENRLVFYFSGHGHTAKLATRVEMGYIVPVDAPLPAEDERGFFARALDMQLFESYAKRIQAKHALFIFDSCFSGSIFALSKAAPASITSKTANPVRQFISSGSADEQVPDESVFRQQFVAALQGEADMNKDGYVTGAELGNFLEETVINYSKGAQHPQYGKIRDPNLDKGDFVFQLGSIYIQQITETAPSADPEAATWELVKDSTNIADVQAFLKAYPQGRFAQAAQIKLNQLERELTQLLARADLYFQRQWYTTPAETNAFEGYREVLKLDPTNEHAYQQIDKIAAFYKSRGEREAQRGRTPQALEAYRAYLTIVPNDEAILDKVALLEHPIVTPTTMPTARPTPIPSQEGTPTPHPKPTATSTPPSTPLRVTPTPPPKPTATSAAKPTATPTLKPTAMPTLKPAATPTAVTPEPTASPSFLGDLVKKAHIDLEDQEAKRKAQEEADRKAQEAWQAWQKEQAARQKEQAARQAKLNEMEKAFSAVEEFVTQDIAPELKVEACERFVKAFAEDNPYSTRDEELRNMAQASIHFLQHTKTESDPITGMELIWLPAGCFQMGSPDSEAGHSADEGPVHEVCVEGFWIGKYEVTQAQWQKIMGSNPAYFNSQKIGEGASNHPVESVSWDDAQEFIKKLNQMAQSVETPRRGVSTFRLPTEAEWEYACRAGTQTAYSFGDDAARLGDYAWYTSNSESRTHPVGQRKPNAFGLYDMHGNVWEWCQDIYTSDAYQTHQRQNPVVVSGGSYRVLRGGSWDNVPGNVRSAFRSNLAPSFRYFSIGFRLVRTN
jgi:formylglycine-generating enzyme required for sulfatase activity